MEQKKDNKTEELNLRQLPKPINLFVSLVAIAMSLYHLSTAVWGTPEWLVHRPLHVTFVLVMGYLLYKGFKKDNFYIFGFDIILSLISLMMFVYIQLDFERIATRIPFTDPLTPLDYFFGIAALLLVLELTRRTTGWPIILVALFFMGNALFGRYYPGFLKNPGTSIEMFIDHMFFTSDGLFGMPVSVSASYVFLFVLLGVFLEVTEIGDFFINIATSITQKLRGGPAKSAIIASGLFGSISGSAVANVYATGTFTIPLMKRSGFKPYFAGAVESVASSGGAFMPPVMGSAAFLMADFIGKPYLEIAKASLVPAILYYLALWFMVDIEARYLGLFGKEKNDTKIFGLIFKKIYLFLPILVIVVLLILQYTPFYAAFFAIVSTVVVGAFNNIQLVKPKKIIEALEQAGKKAITIAAPLTCASIVVGCISLTGAGLKLTSIILRLSEGSLPVALFLTTIITIILGMGLPTPAAYLIVAIFAPSAMIQLGVPTLTAHLFCFYYAAISTITPPVAMAAYAGGIIAGANINKTAFTAMKLGIAAYIIPWIFVYSEELLLHGSIVAILPAIVTAIIGIFVLASGAQGYFFGKISLVIRLILIIASIVMIIPGIYTDLMGLLIIVGVYLYQKRMNKGEKTQLNSRKG